MNALRRWGPGSRLALGTCLLAGALAVWGSAEAWRLEPLPEGPPGQAWDLAMADVATSGHVEPTSVVFAAVSRDPFRSDRRRSLARYRMPGEPLPSAITPGLRPVYAGLALVGTAVKGKDRLAVLQMPRQPARLVAVGDSIAGLQLTSVERRMVTLSGPDTTVVLELPGPPGEAQRKAAADTTGQTPAPARQPSSDGTEPAPGPTDGVDSREQATSSTKGNDR